MARGRLPAGLARVEPDAPVEHVDRGLTGVGVLGKPRAGLERDHGLAQPVLVPTEDGVGAAAAGGGGRELQLLTGECGQGDVGHGPSGSTGMPVGGTASGRSPARRWWRRRTSSLTGVTTS